MALASAAILPATYNGEQWIPKYKKDPPGYGGDL